MLVDGFSIAKQFRELCPAGYKFLSSMATPAHYIGDDQHHLSLDYIFKHCPVTDNLLQIRQVAYYVSMFLIFYNVYLEGNTQRCRCF